MGLALATAVVVVLLPFVLAWIFHGSQRADARGRPPARR